MHLETRSKNIIFLTFLALFFTAQYSLFNTASPLTPNLDWPFLIDLVITVPLVYWLLFRPSLKQLLLKTLTLFCFGIFVGSFIIPKESQQLWPYLIELRYLAIAIFIIIEVSLLASLIHIIKNLSKGQNFIEKEISKFLDKRKFSETLKELYLLEARVWLYALFSRNKSFEFQGEQHFHYAKHNGNASNQQGFIFIILFELPIAHFILHLAWSPTAAYWISGLTVYGLIFMYADYKATLMRPISITDDSLIMRYGVWGNAKIPLSQIENVSIYNQPVKRSKNHLRFCQFGNPNICIQLKPNTEIQTAFVKSVKGKVFLGLDNPQNLINAFSRV